MEEDDATNARVDAVIGGEQQLPVPATVLFGVLGADGAQALGNASWEMVKRPDGWVSLVSSGLRALGHTRSQTSLLPPPQQLCDLQR